ncbi:haloacid dehalogenase [Leptolyngbya sp. BL0902]|uniref:HAD family hydrolase n=1 Tax=Leptolyngbya sp. BL0902 TaxID=1115757 RepID=UPI0018E74510|nr:HAD family hydrolase [Leptolyngbya sp. BL0902]QQE63971.1 haloacid dehalogenase [Leptolyngbya sp. BL0902]
MDYPIIATDYDGTLATEGIVDEATLSALERYRRHGGHLMLVTGRQLDDLLRVFPHSHWFEGIVAENGAVFYQPQRDRVQLLADPFPPILVETLREAGVEPLSQGQVIVATWEPHGDTVRRTLQDLGLGATVILNKRAIMILPQGVDKASGLAAALAALDLAHLPIVGIGDAENDRSLLQACTQGVAVANALPALKAIADYTTQHERGAGVQDVIQRLIENRF